MEKNSEKHCGKCDRRDSVDDLVTSDRCGIWMHFQCAGVTDLIADPDRSWRCDRCRSHKDSESVSKISIGTSCSSRRSTRLEISIQMVEEQRRLKLQQLAEKAAEE